MQVLDFNPDLASPRQRPFCTDVGHTVPLCPSHRPPRARPSWGCKPGLSLRSGSPALSGSRGPVSCPRRPGSGCHPAGLLTTRPAWALRPAEPNGFAEPRPSVPPTAVGTTRPSSWQKHGVFCKTVVLLGASPPARDLLQVKAAQTASAGPLCGARVGLVAWEEAGAVAVRTKDRSHAYLGGSPNDRAACMVHEDAWVLSDLTPGEHGRPWWKCGGQPSALPCKHTWAHTCPPSHTRLSVGSNPRTCF